MQKQASRPQAYPIRGTLSGVRRINENAIEGTLDFVTRAGKPQTVIACAYGRAVILVGRQFRDGPTHLFGHFDKDRFIAYCEARQPRPPVTPAPEPQPAPVSAEREPSPARPAPTEPQAVGRHWKMQAYGPGRSLRRQIEVRAYRRYEKTGA